MINPINYYAPRALAVAGPLSVLTATAYILTQDASAYQIAHATIIGVLGAGSTIVGIMMIREQNLEQRIEKKK